MKKPSVILFACAIVMISCSKNKEYHPELGDGNNEIITIGFQDVSVKYYRTDIAELSKVEFHYKPEYQPYYVIFDTVEMIKKDNYFELTLNGLLSNTLYTYKYELFYKNGDIDERGYYSFYTDSVPSSIPPVMELPKVITAEITEITENTAKCRGELTSMGSAEVTNCGVCWSKTPNPTPGGSHINTDVGVNDFFVTMSGLEANTVYYVRAYAVNSMGIGYGEERCFTTSEYNGGDWVDLGLPSGLLWATRNVGANSPEDYGAYFAWGETQPKISYDWTNYRFGDRSQLIKYCNNSDYGLDGFTDNLTTLQPEDDAATSNWGGRARTPAFFEWSELYNYCSSNWTIQDGVAGMLFTGTNGNSIFLPAAGEASAHGLMEGSSRGYYWSSDLSDSPSFVSTLGITSFHCYGVGLERFIGHSVRPVRSL